MGDQRLCLFSLKSDTIIACGASMRENNIARIAFTRHIHGWKMASLFTGVSKTPVKILRAMADDCCRVCNVPFPTYGCIGRFNLFEGKNSRVRIVGISSQQGKWRIISDMY